MAVVDKRQYVTTDNSPTDAVQASGADTINIIAKASITSGDTTASIYRIAEVPASFVLMGGEITCDAIVDVDDADLGLYENEQNGDTVIDADAFVDGMDIHAAKVPGAGYSPLSAVTIANQDAAFYTIAGDASGERQTYVIGLKINKTAGATGVVVVRLKLVRREYAS